jgi:Flp pilus assembly protein TadB
LTQVVRHDADRHADLALTVQALSATAHLGGPVAATLDEAAAVLRERAAARAERRAHGSQARLSARVLTIVPLVFAVWSAVASQRTRDIYLSSVAGGICASCGLALNLAGWQWMKRTIGPM